jgi:hypothetical protein
VKLTPWLNAQDLKHKVKYKLISPDLTTVCVNNIKQPNNIAVNKANPYCPQVWSEVLDLVNNKLSLEERKIKMLKERPFV